MDEKKPTRFGHLEDRKLEWPPRFSKEVWQEALKAREEQLKNNAPPVPVAFPASD